MQELTLTSEESRKDVLLRVYNHPLWSRWLCTFTVPHLANKKPPKSSKFIQILHILLHLEHLQGSNLIQLGWREMREHCNVRLVWTCTPVCQCDLLGRLAAGGLGRGWMPDVISGVHWKYPDHILKWHWQHTAVSIKQAESKCQTATGPFPAHSV